MEKFKFSAVVFTADVSRHFLPDVGEVDFVLDFASLKIPKNPLVVDFDHDSAAPIVGTAVKAGEGMGFVQTYYGMEELVPAIDGRVVAVLGKQGDKVAKGEIVAFVEGDSSLRSE